MKGTLTIKAGQDVELADGAHTTGPVKVKAGGLLDVEGATLSGPLTANGATSLRICGAGLAATVKVVKSSGPVVLGDGGGGCDPSVFSGPVTLSGNTAGVTVEGQSLLDPGAFHGSLKVTKNSGWTTVLDNEVAGPLTVTSNAAPVVDAPNAVEGKTKGQ